MSRTKQAPTHKSYSVITSVAYSSAERVAEHSSPASRVARRTVFGSVSGVLSCAIMMSCTALVGCGEGIESNVVVERLPDPEPNLPEVPELPPPPHPSRYGDQSYSIYGVRHMTSVTMDHDVAVTGYIVEIYQRPDCDDEEACPRAVAPHFYIADVANESDASKRVMVAGYATRQGEVDEAVALARRNRSPEVVEGGPPPVPTDLAVGNKVTVRARFQRYSNVGFSASNGLLEFQGHTTVETASGS